MENEKYLKSIQRELDKISYDFKDLSEKEKDMLIKVEHFIEHQKLEFKSKFKDCIHIKCNVDSYCKYIGISRATIYKKYNGINPYSKIITYINSRTANLESFKKNLIKDYYKAIDNDTKIIEQLLTHEVEYIQMKNKLEEIINENNYLKDKIKLLEDDLNKSTKLN